MKTKTRAQELYQKLSAIKTNHLLCQYTLERCERLAPYIDSIEKLKSEKKAVILAHSYVHPDIIYGVADHVGDSYFLAKMAMESNAETIVFPAVRFMAETAKILNPNKTVIDPNPNGGCSLADAITGDEVLALREKYPDHTFVCYINTTAAVKAACDVCVTSSNVYTIIERIDNNKIFFLPDRLMGENIINHLKKNNIAKEIRLFDGTCYVHEEFTPEEIDVVKMQHPNAQVLVHPECKPEVIAKGDMVGSTGNIVSYVKEHQNEGNPFLILTECGIASRLQVEHPGLEIVGSCMMCKYMKSNSLQQVEEALSNPKPSQIVEIDPAIADRARNCIKQMFEIIS